MIKLISCVFLIGYLGAKIMLFCEVEVFLGFFLISGKLFM